MDLDFLYGTLGMDYSFLTANIQPGEEKIPLMLVVDERVGDNIGAAYPSKDGLRGSAQAMVDRIAFKYGSGAWGKERAGGNWANCFLERKADFGVLLVRPSGGGKCAVALVSNLRNIGQVNEWFMKDIEKNIGVFIKHIHTVLKHQRHENSVLAFAPKDSIDAVSCRKKIFSSMLKGGTVDFTWVVCSRGEIGVCIIAEKDVSRVLDKRYPKVEGLSPLAISAKSSFAYLDRIGWKCGKEFCGHGIHAIYQRDCSYGVLVVKPERLGESAIVFLDGIDEVRDMFDYATLINPCDAWDQCMEIASMMKGAKNGCS